MVLSSSSLYLVVITTEYSDLGGYAGLYEASTACKVVDMSSGTKFSLRHVLFSWHRGRPNFISFPKNTHDITPDAENRHPEQSYNLFIVIIFFFN